MSKNNTYWTEEKLNPLTVEDALEDYKYGFYTSMDADSMKVLTGNHCCVCGNIFWETRERVVKELLIGFVESVK